MLQFMKYLNAFNHISGVGPKTMKRLVDFFGSGENAWKSDETGLKSSGIGEKTAQKIKSERNKINPDEKWKIIEKEGIDILTPDSQNYPKLLLEIPSFPYLLYTRGHDDFFNGHPMVAIVGSRKNTAYGEEVARSMARDLAVSGIAIVSGMAIGIDSMAHRGALDDENGRTVAVLGNGVDDVSIHPKTNFNLSKEIMSRGILVSEYPPHFAPNANTFPARNRIIAGMSLGTLVIEASSDSGALITARYAIEFNRDVYVIPGPINSPQSAGTNNLGKEGAKIVTCAKDILEDLNINQVDKITRKKTVKPETDEEKMILKVMSHEPVHIDNISKISKLQTARVSSALSMMEIKGWVKNIGGQNYILL